MSTVPLPIPELSTSELERRMRPGAYSEGGFLGQTESLPGIDIGYLVGEKLQVFIYITGPGLIVHLIRAHQFFEGSESPYRVEPRKAIRVLALLEAGS